ncbi:bile acid:sodium symporter [Methylococcaceae bacterium HT4]|nr:bile acid:sodium symporter [Methylococcaceae bacterium HT4]TXL21052.1 bile acid:sodium symporter [Methylococcaceae bacterium HT5]
MSNRGVIFFPIGALLLSLIAYFNPAPFTHVKGTIIPLLALVMFFMGMTLTWQHFKQALKQPLIILLTISIQFIFMPLFAYLLANALQLSEAHTIGLVLVGCSAGGTASNVICYLAKGNVALSILMTMASTLCAVIAMPLLSYIYLSQSVAVPVTDMMRSILLIVFLPVVTGTAINSFLGRYLIRVQGLFPLFSSVAIALIIAIIVALNQHNFASLSWAVLAAVVLHNMLGMGVGSRLSHKNFTCISIASKAA